MSQIDRSKFRRRLLLRLISSPATVVPFLAGVTDLLALWAFNIDSGAAAFAGVACILGSIGVAASRYLLGGKSLDREVVESLEQEAARERDRALDALDRDLSADGDPRTEIYLRDLRSLAGRFREGRSWEGALGSRGTFDILTGVDRLFKQSVLALEQSLALWNTAQEITLPVAREPILRKRETLIEEVERSIEHLGRVLAGVRTLGEGTGSDPSELARIRDELDNSLGVARRVEERMKALDLELGRDPGTSVRSSAGE